MPEAAVFNINIEGNAAEQSAKSARAMEELRAKIQGSKDALRQYSETLGLLKGKDAETLDARTKLKAAIDREKAAINANALALGKLGGNYGALAAKARKAAADVSSSGNALKLVGGPLEEARSKIETLSKAFEGADAGAVLMVGTLGLVAIAVAAVAAGVVAGAIAFGKWVLGAADVNRSLELVREGAVNSAKEAGNLGGIVDQLAKKSPLAKAEINDLGTELYRTFNNTSANAKVGGQIIEDTLSLVTAATSAANASVGNQLKSIVERGKMMQRMQLGRQDLFGTGVKVEDVAGALAKNLHVGVKEAQQALLEGRVTLSDGAKALNEAVQKRFGEINARKMLSADVIFAKFHETLIGFAKGVNLEPLANAAGKFFALFNDENAVGASLKKITEVLGNDLIGALVKLEPLAEEVFLRIVNAVLDVVIAGYELKNSFNKTFGAGSALWLAKEPFEIMYNVAYGIMIAAKGIAWYFGDAAKDARTLANIGGGSSNTADYIKGSAHVRIAPANADGGEVQRPAPGESFASVAPGEHIVPAGSTLGGGGGGSGVGLSVSLGGIHLHASGAALDKAKAAVEAPSFIADLTRAVEQIMQAAGVPIMTVPT